ncbi:MAG: M20 family peptidase [Promethearchaeota archaeon]|nr:MAG: M20 family peptidase [Candidatus Lokiarchaeota archaeon]
MDELEKIILDKIENMREEIITFHQKIVQIPSENPPRKFKEIVEFTENKFKELGLETQVKRNNAIGKLISGEGPTLILYGHLDTVEAFKGWTQDPFGGKIIDGKIYGRGASDDKSSITSEIFATKALIEAGVKLNGNLILTAVIDEETGGLRGADYLLKNEIIKGDACLLGDAPCDYPFGYTGGTMYITFTTFGKIAHGLGFPDLPLKYRSEHSGINAIEKMMRIMNFLLRLKEEFLRTETKYSLPEGWNALVSSVNIAEIHGGNKITTVPDKCFLHVSINTIPEQDIGSIRERIMNYVEELKHQDHDFNVTVQIPIAFEPQVIDENSDFAKAVQKATNVVFGEERGFKLFLPSTDAHWFQERGIPTILIGSSREDNNVHAKDEFVYIDDLINTTKLFALTALNYLK